MVIMYCSVCRRIRIDAAEAREMVADFNAAESMEKADISHLIDEIDDPIKLEQLSASLNLQIRRRVDVPDEFQGEDWVKLSDKEWGAIQVILESPSLVYLVGNYADYPEICPDCAIAEEVREKAKEN
jgi:hypothetical protein